MILALLPFEVVRRRGVFMPRAQGLASLCPDRFLSSKTGDYLIPAPAQQRYHWGSYRQQEAAITFERFIRKRFGARTKLRRLTDPTKSVVCWSLQILDVE